MPDDPVVRRCYLHDIIPFLQRRLREVTGFPEERVLVDVDGTDEDVLRGQADQIICIIPGDQALADAEVSGGGRYYERVLRTLDVKIWTRLALDEISQGFQLLCDPDLGHFALELKIYDALAGFLVYDDDENLLTDHLKVRNASRPKRSPKERDWVSSIVYCEIGFEVNVDPSLDA